MEWSSITGVGWGVSVAVNELGARLQSYLETKPSVDTLRLCNRFGKGTEAFVMTLPVEILELVVQHVRWMDLESNMEKWSQSQRCCENICDALEHWTGEELLDMHEDFDLFSDCPCGNKEQAKGCKMLNECIEGEFGLWWDAHLEKQGELHHLVQKLSLEDTKGVFGLEALFDIKMHSDEEEPPEYIMFAYLVLPDSFSATSSWQPSIVLDPEVLKPLMPNQSSRFEVAMRTLQLQPLVHHCQFGRIERPSKLGQPDCYSDEMKKWTKDLEDSKWPKLLLLNGRTYNLIA